MRHPNVYVLESDEECASCDQLLKEDTIVVEWAGDFFCSLPCYRQALESWEERPGLDFYASQDQAFAALDEMRAKKPQHFVFLFSTEDENGEFAMGSTIFAHPGFVVACIPALMEGLTSTEPSVAPPPD